MELPQCLSALSPRSMDDVAAAALAVQANVVTLRVALGRKVGHIEGLDEIRTPSPGAVTQMRHMLLDRETVKAYSPDETMMRLRQVWGEFCALCWLFPFVKPQSPMDFHTLPPAQTMRCCSDVLSKQEQVQRNLWRIRLEMRLRFDEAARRDPAMQREFETAAMTPLSVYGEDVRFCADDALFAAACEHAGMLAALRWASDDRWAWEAPGIMDVVLTN